jgi:hypothetical protein
LHDLAALCNTPIRLHHITIVLFIRQVQAGLVLVVTGVDVLADFGAGVERARKNVPGGRPQTHL